MRRKPPLLHRLLLGLPPETAHRVAVNLLKCGEHLALSRWIFGRWAPRHDPRLRQDLLGLTFANPLGLAAGFDKDGEVVDSMAALGFGWLEVGTVTPRPQPGNPRPRLFRYPEASSLENRMGFNNAGGQALRRRLSRRYPTAVPLGVNVGKNRETPNDSAAADYLSLIDDLSGHCDYFVINVSSPNTPGLRDLQDPRFLCQLVAEARSLAREPVLVKLSPDLEREVALSVASAAVAAGAAGIILTNTTADYALLAGARGVGGLSGAVLREKSFAVFDAVARELFGSCVLVSVGGIDSAREIYRRLRAGAALVQLYTALVFAGPRLVGRLVEDLAALLAEDGVESIAEVVGADR